MKDLTEEQVLLMQAAKDFVAKRAPIETLDERERSATAGPTSMWTEMGEMGWLGLMVPEELGGSGGSIVDLELVAESVGTVLMPPPFVASAAGAAAALMAAADSAAARTLLADLCAGRAVPVLAAGGDDGRWDDHSACIESGGTVTGTVGFVEGASSADHFLVATGIGERSGLVLVPRTERVVVEVQPAIVGNAWSTVRFAATPGEVLPVSRSALDGAVSHLATAASGWCAGAAQELLERTVDYVSGRLAFGVPVGSFQAVQHSLADCAIATAEAQSLARRAAKSLHDQSSDARRMASIAYVRSTSALVDVSRRCHQVWGGMGFTREAHVHHFSRRAKLMQMSWGGASHHRRVISDELRAREVILRQYRRSPPIGGGA